MAKSRLKFGNCRCRQADLLLSQQTGRSCHGFYFAIYLCAEKEHKAGETDHVRRMIPAPRPPLFDARSEAFTKQSSSTSICETFVLCFDSVLQTAIRNIGLSGGLWRQFARLTRLLLLIEGLHANCSISRGSLICRAP
jgi:hypothetical protein